MSAEEWRPVVGASRYEVSDRGRVRSNVRRSRPRVVMALRHMKNGYQVVELFYDADHRQLRRTRLVHHLVLEAFVGPRPEGHETRHLDGVRDNNRLSNLRWGTPSENRLDVLRHGTDHNVNKAYCPAGHEYNAENTYVKPTSTSRNCRICTRAAGARYRRRKAARQTAA